MALPVRFRKGEHYSTQVIGRRVAELEFRGGVHVVTNKGVFLKTLQGFQRVGRNVENAVLRQFFLQALRKR